MEPSIRFTVTSAMLLQCNVMDIVILMMKEVTMMMKGRFCSAAAGSGSNFCYVFL